jgi:hypothetical protein
LSKDIVDEILERQREFEDAGRRSVETLTVSPEVLSQLNKKASSISELHLNNNTGGFKVNVFNMMKIVVSKNIPTNVIMFVSPFGEASIFMLDNANKEEGKPIQPIVEEKGRFIELDYDE